jgi:hypothetical protein
MSMNTNRDFRSIKNDIINFIKSDYPDTINDFNDGAVASLFIDMLAGVADNLQTNIDRVSNENTVEFAQEYSSLFELAKTRGIKIPNITSSITIVELSVTLPVKFSNPDLNYAPFIIEGSQVIGNGVVFELGENVDFANPFSDSGIPNRTIIPNYNNATGNIDSYTLKKSVIASSGRTKIYKKITPSIVGDFYSFFLPDSDIVELNQIIVLPTTNIQNIPTLENFYNRDLLWYEVEALAENQIFIENFDINNQDSIVNGKWITTEKRFITEYTSKGFMKITFGAGEINVDNLIGQYDNNSKALLDLLEKKVNKNALGVKPPPSSTIFVKYRVGSERSNVGTNTITSFGSINIIVNGENSTINNNVKNSLTVTNKIPALGNRGRLTIEEIRNLIKYYVGAQNRVVTVNDYIARIGLMSSKFGAPYKYNIVAENGIVNINVLNIDQNFKLTGLNTTTLKQNIGEYLKKYKSPFATILIGSGKIINLAFEIDILTENNQFTNKNDISISIIDAIYNELNVNTREMGDDINISRLIQLINEVSGVLNVNDIRVSNKINGVYSTNQTGQKLLNQSTRLIDYSNSNQILCANNEMFEVKFKENDIRVRFGN